MKKMIAALVLAASTMIAVPAMAQTKKKAPAKSHDQTMKFEPLGIEGGVGGPDGMLIDGTKRPKFTSFDLVRRTFYDKLVRLPENL